MPDITVDDVIAVANEAYGDDLVLDYYQGEERGDTLAKFIAIELDETFGPEGLANAYDVAAHQIESAIDQLQDVRDALLSASEELI